MHREVCLKSLTGWHLIAVSLRVGASHGVPRDCNAACPHVAAQQRRCLKSPWRRPQLGQDASTKEDFFSLVGAPTAVNLRSWSSRHQGVSSRDHSELERHSLWWPSFMASDVVSFSNLRGNSLKASMVLSQSGLQASGLACCMVKTGEDKRRDLR